MSSVGEEVIEHYESLHESVAMDWWQREWTVDTLGVRDDGSWAAFESALNVQRQNGKGSPADAIELGGLFLLGETLIVHSAHQMKTSREAFVRVAKIVDANDELSKHVRRVMRSKGEEGFELMDGRRLMFFSRSDGSGKGFTGNRIFLDEAQELEGEEMASMAPTMMATVDAQVCYTFTPPRRRGSHVARLRRRAKARTDDRTIYYGWENPRGTSLDDLAAYAAANPAYPHRITRERIEDMRRAIGDDELFARECMGIWQFEDEDGWLVISEQLWEDGRDPLSEPKNVLALACDVLPDRAAAAICAAGHRADGLLHLELTGKDGVADYLPGAGWAVPRLQEIVANLGRGSRPCVVVVNDQAVAEAAANAGLTVYRPQVRDVAAWCGQFFDEVAGPHAPARRLRHRGQVQLDSAVALAEKRPMSGGFGWLQNPVLTAASLAVGGLLTPRIHQVSRQPVSAFVAQGGGAGRKQSNVDQDGNRVIRMGGGSDNDRSE